ncbi:PP2C family protein-serine/threonine phosphatase [Streptomyces sp. NPDC001843]|uniref:PP2C family protein-serine/threonine phosphatase n=1 Tax=Streptomyces sp. NPDC001843 TaxID=3364617 RepID=UPI003696D9A3
MSDREVLRRRQPLRIRGRSVAWVVPLLLLVGITTVDVNTAANVRIISWIVLVPGIAAALCGLWTTALFALLAVVDYVLVDSVLFHQYKVGWPDFVLVTLGGILATLACAVRLRGERRMLHMRDIAETTRRTVLRPLPPGWAGLEHAAAYLAADTEARVGGDFYDIQPGPHGTRVLLGDVQGKGLGAVEAAAALLGTFREIGYHAPDLATVAAHLEVRMGRHRFHTTSLGRADGDRFATAVLIGFPVVDDGTVEVVNFGHEPPLVIGADGVRALPAGDRLPLGLGELVPTAHPPPPARVRLGPGETVLLTTDGVTEARDGRGVFYDLVGQVARATTADPGTARPRRLTRLVREGVLRHSGGHLVDDTTIFAVRRIEGVLLGGRFRA